MVRDIMRDLRLSTLSEAETRSALTYWIQNVLAMSVSLKDKPLTDFCHRNDLTPQHLFDAADELDINLAFLDDLVAGHALANEAVEQ